MGQYLTSNTVIQGFDIVDDGLYIWTGCYASKNASGQYWNSQTIARVKFEVGKRVTPKECTTQFYMGPFKELHPAIDVANDVLAINYPTSHPTEPRRFRMYRLSEAMALPMSAVTLQSLTYVTIYDFAGNVVERRTAVTAASDLQTLASLGITASGYMEAEGIKVRNGKLYLGFASRDSKTDGSKYRANVFAYARVE